MTPAAPSDAADLQRFNREVLGQALALVSHHLGDTRACYAGPVGAHLRHVIEHYDALRAAGDGGAVDYDRRPRDRELECCPQTAQRRLLVLDRWLADADVAALNAPLRVHGLVGLGGERAFTVASTLGRELVFVAGHAVHHYALLEDHCRRHGIEVDVGFGKAPSTVAHERLAALAPSQVGASTSHHFPRKDHVTL